GFGAEFEPAGGGLVRILLLLLALESAVEERALVVAAHLTVGDGDVLARPRFAERVGALETDAVVPRAVDRAVADADVAAGVDVHAVAVGVHLDVVDGEIVDAGGEDAEVPALADGDVVDLNVAAELERDGFVPAAFG